MLRTKFERQALWYNVIDRQIDVCRDASRVYSQRLSPPLETASSWISVTGTMLRVRFPTAAAASRWRNKRTLMFTKVSALCKAGGGQKINPMFPATTSPASDRYCFYQPFTPLKLIAISSSLFLRHSFQLQDSLELLEGWPNQASQSVSLFTDIVKQYRLIT